MNQINKNRIKKEIQMLSSSPPAGIFCTSVEDRLDLLSAQILGQEGTPFEGGVYHLEIQIPDRYPFDPPTVRFVTPIYHPNIDTNGRICLDTLKLPPKGTWRPCLNISTVLMMIRILMAEPGSEDPLMTAVWQEYKYNYTLYAEKAKQWTCQHAMQSSGKNTKVLPSTSVLKKSAASPSSKSKDKSHKADHQSIQETDRATKPEINHQVSTGKKSLGLGTKRQALEERNANLKVFKGL